MTFLSDYTLTSTTGLKILYENSAAKIVTFMLGLYKNFLNNLQLKLNHKRLQIIYHDS